MDETIWPAGKAPPSTHKRLSLASSLLVARFSEEGFDWGRDSPGTRQTAMAISCAILGEKMGPAHYDRYLAERVRTMPKDSANLGFLLRWWLQEHEHLIEHAQLKYSQYTLTKSTASIVPHEAFLHDDYEIIYYYARGMKGTPEVLAATERAMATLTPEQAEIDPIPYRIFDHVHYGVRYRCGLTPLQSSRKSEHAFLLTHIEGTNPTPEENPVGWLSAISKYEKDGDEPLDPNRINLYGRKVHTRRTLEGLVNFNVRNRLPPAWRYGDAYQILHRRHSFRDEVILPDGSKQILRSDDHYTATVMDMRAIEQYETFTPFIAAVTY